MQTPIRFFAAVLLTLPLAAQCGRCGPDGGPPGVPVGVVRTYEFRSVRPAALPDGIGTVSIRVETYSAPLEPLATQVLRTTLIVADASVSRPVTLTALEVRPSAPGTPYSLGISAANPISLPAGQSTIAVQGGDTDLFTGVLFARSTDRPEGFLLGSFAEAKKSMFLANPPAAVVAVSTNAAYQTDGSLGSATVRVQVRSSAFVPPTALALRHGGANGPIAFEFPLSSSLSGAVTFDTANSPEALALAVLLRDPGSIYAELRAGSASVGGAPLGRPDTAGAVFVNPGFDVHEPSSLSATSTVTIHALRTPAGAALASVATVDLLYRGVKPGTNLSQMTFGGPGTPILTFSPLENPLTVNSTGTGTLSLTYPLLPDDPLLRYLQAPTTLTAIILAQPGAQPVIRMESTGLAAFPPPGLAVTSIVPPISTPGSIVSIYGRSFPKAPLVAVGGVLGTVLYAGPSQINLIVPATLVPPTGRPLPSTQVYVIGPDAISNPMPLYVDVTEPFIFVDATGPAVFFAASGIPVRSFTPAGAGEELIVYCTGLAIREDITYTVSVSGRSVSRLIAAPAPGLPGVWTLTFRLPSGIDAGSQPLTVKALFDGPTRGEFPSAPVRIDVR